MCTDAIFVFFFGLVSKASTEALRLRGAISMSRKSGERVKTGCKRAVTRVGKGVVQCLRKVGNLKERLKIRLEPQGAEPYHLFSSPR